MSVCSLLVVLSSMAVGHCLPSLIADYGSSVLFLQVITDCFASCFYTAFSFPMSVLKHVL